MKMLTVMAEYERPKIRCRNCKKVALTAYPIDGALEVECRYCGHVMIVKPQERRPYGERLQLVVK